MKKRVKCTDKRKPYYGEMGTMLTSKEIKQPIPDGYIAVNLDKPRDGKECTVILGPSKHWEPSDA